MENNIYLKGLPQLAHEYMKNGQVDEAIRCYNEILEIDPNNIQAKQCKDACLQVSRNKSGIESEGKKMKGVKGFFCSFLILLAKAIIFTLAVILPVVYFEFWGFWNLLIMGSIFFFMSTIMTDLIIYWFGYEFGETVILEIILVVVCSIIIAAMINKGFWIGLLGFLGCSLVFGLLEFAGVSLSEKMTKR